MSSKKRSRKGIESLDKQIRIHEEKIRIAQESGNEGLVRYHEKEIVNFRRVKERKKKRIMPKMKMEKF